jgi:hypothetical protein
VLEKYPSLVRMDESARYSDQVTSYSWLINWARLTVDRNSETTPPPEMTQLHEYVGLKDNKASLKLWKTSEPPKDKGSLSWRLKWTSEPIGDEDILGKFLRKWQG